jgi:hypothetical protein
VIAAGMPQVVTWKSNMTDPRWLGNLGPVGGLSYSYALPGGCDQLQVTLYREPSFRTDAMDPGRIVQATLNGSVIWDGQMLEPLPQTGGWLMTATGTASWGTNYVAYYTGPWQNGVVDTAVNAAIARGLRWTNPGVGTPSGAWLGQAVDPAAQTITDLLNLFTSNGGLVWYVAPKGNVLSVFPLPTTVTRLLVSTAPVPRTLGGNLNTIYERYQNTTDASGDPGTFATTFTQTAADVSQFGSPMEDFVDLSSVGVMSQSAAQLVGSMILQRYQGASWSQPFSVTPGQLLTTGGQPVDLAQEQAGQVYRILLTDGLYAAEDQPGPVEFIVGEYAFDVDSQTATVTPFQSLNMQESTVMAEPFTQRVTTADLKYARHAIAKAKAAAAKAARAKKLAKAKTRAKSPGK